MEVTPLEAKDFVPSVINDTVHVNRIQVVPNEAGGEFLWHAATTTFDKPFVYPALSGYNRLVVRLTGDELLVNHDSSAHSQVVKKNVFYEFSGDWHTKCEVQSACSDFEVTYKAGEVAVSAEVFESRKEEIIIPLSAKGTCTILFGINGDSDLTYKDESYQLTPGNAIIINGGLSYDKEDDEECVVKSADQSGETRGRLICVQFSVNPDVLSLYHIEDVPHDSNLQEHLSIKDKQGRRKLKHIPSVQYSSINLHSYRWQRHPYVPPKPEIPPTNTSAPLVLDSLDPITQLEIGKIHNIWINLVQDGFGEYIKIPVIVARGTKDGPIFGITAAVHGNELNGVPGIHRLMSHINIARLSGTVVACPCVNVTGFLNYVREFHDGKDLNRVFPGAATGFASQVYCHAILEKLIKPMQYHIDLHTASFGRVNSYYIRADLKDPIVDKFAWLCNPQIILHNSGQDGTLRGAATSMGIKSITIEVGNPQSFQNRYINWTYAGVRRLLDFLGMYPLSDVSNIGNDKDSTILCSGGFWMYTKCGGIMEVFPGVNANVKKGDLIAIVKNIFGVVLEEVFAPNDAVVVGRSSNPVAFSGDRIIHLGLPHDPSRPLPEARAENY